MWNNHIVGNTQQCRFRQGSQWRNVLFAIAMAAISQTGEWLWIQFSHLLYSISWHLLPPLVYHWLSTAGSQTTWRLFTSFLQMLSTFNSPFCSSIEYFIIIIIIIYIYSCYQRDCFPCKRRGSLFVPHGDGTFFLSPGDFNKPISLFFFPLTACWHGSPTALRIPVCASGSAAAGNHSVCPDIAETPAQVALSRSSGSLCTFPCNI